MNYVQLFIQEVEKLPNYGVQKDSQRQCAYYVIFTYCGYRKPYLAQLFKVSIRGVIEGIKRQRDYLKYNDPVAVTMYNKMLEIFIKSCRKALNLTPLPCDNGKL